MMPEDATELPARTAASPAVPLARLPLRAWRAAGRILGRAGLGLAAAGRAGWTWACTAVIARVNATARAHPGRLLPPVRLARRMGPRARFLAEAEALLTARAHGFAAAAPLFAEIAARPCAGSAAAAALLRPASPGPVRLAIPLAARPSFVPEADAAGTVVMTAAFGRPPALPPVVGAGRVRFLCFADALTDSTAAPGWTILPPAAGSPDPAAHPAAATAFHKIRAADALAGTGARASLWLDPDRQLIGNLDTLLARWLLPQDLALWRHADGDWRAMAERHLVAGTVPTTAIIAQAECFAAARVPGDRGGCDTGMIWRRHDAPGVAALSDAWWENWRAAPGADDLALYRVLAEDPAALRPAILPTRLGSADDNVFVARVTPREERSRGPRGTPPAKPLPVVFLGAARFATFASTFLRGRQLSAMVAAAFPDYDVRFTEDAESVRGAVVVLTKGAMGTLDTAAIAALGRRNLATIGCWDDIRPEPAKARAVDAHMTLSFRQTLELNRLYPQTPAFLVTHHVNRQVPAVTPPADRLRTGYFGDLGNTVRPASLAEMIDLVDTGSRSVSDGWLSRLPDYNCHWIVRQFRPWDSSFKPFLKGFLAARCGAPVIVTAEDGDAGHYLGDDYPFYARSTAAADLEMALATAAAGFGGPDWARARDIMAQVAARSTDAQVCAEFRLMIEAVIA